LAHAGTRQSSSSRGSALPLCNPLRRHDRRHRLSPPTVATPHPVSRQREDTEDITPPPQETTGSARVPIPAVSEDFSEAGGKERSELAPLTRPAARADLASPSRRTVPGVQRLTVFAHRILEARQRLLPRETAIARSAPQLSTSTDPLAAGEWPRPAYAEEPIELPLALSAPGTEAAETGAPPGTHAHHAEDWPRPRREIARAPLPPERARHIMDAEIPPRAASPSLSPTPYDAAAIEWTYPDFAFPVPHGTEPPSTPEAYTSPPVPRPLSPTRGRAQPTWESPPEVAPPVLAATPGIDLARGGDLTLTSISGGRPPGTSTAPGLALAPLERPRSGGAAAPAAESNEGEAAGAEEGAQEEAEMNLDRLAREVYAILRRRLAWEQERSLAQIT